MIRSGRRRSSTCPEVDSAIGSRVAVHRLDVAGARVHDQLVALAQHDHEAARADERAAALDDQLEDVLERDLAADRDRDVARRLEAAQRLLELLAAALAGLVQARVVDRDRRPVGEDHRRLLVALGELAALPSRSDTGCPRPARGSRIGTPRKLRITGWPAGNP